jgi:hypothetical protein
MDAVPFELMSKRNSLLVGSAEALTFSCHAARQPCSLLGHALLVLSREGSTPAVSGSRFGGLVLEEVALPTQEEPRRLAQSTYLAR